MKNLEKVQKDQLIMLSLKIKLNNYNKTSNKSI